MFSILLERYLNQNCNLVHKLKKGRVPSNPWWTELFFESLNVETSQIYVLYILLQDDVRHTFEKLIMNFSQLLMPFGWSPWWRIQILGNLRDSATNKQRMSIFKQKAKWKKNSYVRHWICLCLIICSKQICSKNKDYSSKVNRIKPK